MGVGRDCGRLLVGASRNGGAVVVEALIIEMLDRFGGRTVDVEDGLVEKFEIGFAIAIIVIGDVGGQAVAACPDRLPIRE